jgi:uncharacterized protein YdaU (DUF1376 family)
VNQAPWFKFHAAEFLGSRETRFLTAEQRGLYIQLLAEAWQSMPKGTLPSNPETLWKLAGAESREDFEKVSGPVLALFKSEGDLLFSQMLSEQVAALAALIPKRKDAGRKGAVAKWNKQRDGNDVANAVQTDGMSMTTAINLPDRREEKRSDTEDIQNRESRLKLKADHQQLALSKAMPLSDKEWQQRLEIAKEKASVAKRMFGPG